MISFTGNELDIQLSRDGGPTLYYPPRGALWQEKEKRRRHDRGRGEGGGGERAEGEHARRARARALREPRSLVPLWLFSHVVAAEIQAF